MLASGAVLEAPALVAGLDDLAMVGEPVEQRRGHLGVAGEHARPLPEGEVGGDHDGGGLVELADEVEQELAARLREGQVAEFVEHHEVESGEMVGDLRALCYGERDRNPSECSTIASRDLYRVCQLRSEKK